MSLDLEDLVKAWPLPAGFDGLADVPMSRVQLAQALGVSENTITSYINRGMPVLSRGTNGQSYELDLAVCYAWREAERAAEIDRKSKADENARAAAALFRNLSEDELGDASYTAAQIEAESRADYMRNKAAEMRGELVRRHDVQEVFELIFAAVRKNLTTLPIWLEREFGLAPRQVEQVAARSDETLAQIRDAIETGLAKPAEIEDLDGRQKRLGL